MLAELLSPFADRHPPDAQSAGNVGVGELSGLEQPASFQASFFTLTTMRCLGRQIMATDCKPN
jgi:hypothetical protein